MLLNEGTYLYNHAFPYSFCMELKKVNLWFEMLRVPVTMGEPLQLALSVG